MIKRTVLSVRNGGISIKKRRFLKLIRIFVDVKIVYLDDYQGLLCNAKNRAFRRRTTMRRRISSVCVVRTGILLNLFTNIRVNAERDKSRHYRFHPARFIAIICLSYTNIYENKKWQHRNAAIIFV